MKRICKGNNITIQSCRCIICQNIVKIILSQQEVYENFYKDKIDDVVDNASDGKSFKYKTKIVGKTPERLTRTGNPGDVNQPPQPAVPTLNVEVLISLKYFITFWRFLDLLLVNCEVELNLSWTKDCVLIMYHNNIT